MKLNSYQLSEDSFITSVDWPGLDIVRQNKDPEHPYWVVVEDISTVELAENLKHLDLHPLILEDCLSPEHSTLVDRYPDSVYIEFPTNTSNDEVGVAYLSIICLPELIVTVIHGEVTQLPNFITSLQQDRKLSTGNTANLIYMLTDYFIDKTITQGLVYRQHLSLLEKKLDQDPEGIDLNHITDLKRLVSQLEGICEDQLYCAKSLVIDDNTVINPAGQETYFNDLISNGEYAVKWITRLNSRVKDLQDNFTLLHHESSEKRLRILTIISAIFLPLTFITGYFGMNLSNLWLVRVEHGSLIAFAIMTVISLSLLWYFYSRGWFD
jgi:magnesium transporter